MMKSMGMIRNVDEVGRIVLPIELRRVFNIEEKDPIEIFTEDDKIILKKYEPTCIFCGGDKNITSLNNKNICHDCIQKLSALDNSEE